MSPDLDVVIVGGGIQGLLALDTLRARGYACALVSDGDLGSGQTLHSHGFFNTGFGLLGDQLQRASHELVQPYLRAHGLEPTGQWMLIPPPGFPDEGALPATLPAGFDTSIAERVVALSDRSFPKQRLVETMSRGHLARIVRGRAMLAVRGRRVEAVAVRLAATGDEVVLAAKVVVIAAGCASKRMLYDVVGATAQTEQIKHRRVHMICVRAPAGSLPGVSVAAMPLGLMLAAHDQQDNVTWYVTPMEFAGPSYDDVPADASSDVDTEVVARGFQALLRLFPVLPDVESLRVGCYAGYRQDIGDQPGMPMCELVEGTGNVILALPSGLVTPWLNAARIGDIVSELSDPSGAQAPVPGAGIGVQTGFAVEDRPEFPWLSLQQWLQAPSRSETPSTRAVGATGSS